MWRVLKNTNGFTLIELLVVIGITIVLTGVSSVVYGNLLVSTQLNEASSQIAQTVRLAKEQSMSGKNNVAHGVRFDTNEYTLFQGSSYVAREVSYDRVYPLSPSLSLSTTLTGNEIVFSKGVGDPNTSGTVTLSHAVSGSRSFLINSYGIILEQ